eukprot:s1_g1397.t1
MSADRVTAGFIPLIDAAPLIVAQELGFAEEAGIELALVKESSWATLRDRIAVGHFEAAHLLAPIAISGSLGLPPLPVSVIAPLALGTGRNAITVSLTLAEDLAKHGELNGNAGQLGQALKALAEERGSDNRVTIGVVHPFSAHAYFLNYWLRGCEIRPNEDVVVEVLPPSLMVDALKSGRIDACCVGEPWNTVAQNEGVGRAVVACDDIWTANPDKILGVRKKWAEEHPDVVLKTVRCVFQAAKWCDQAQNKDKLIDILSQQQYLNLPSDQVRRSLDEDYLHFGQTAVRASFARPGTTYPSAQHGLWFYNQMIENGQLTHDEQHIQNVKDMYRPNIYRKALAEFADADGKEMSAASRFFDGQEFEPLP